MIKKHLLWSNSFLRTIGESIYQSIESQQIDIYKSLFNFLIERIQAEVGPIQHLVATGGLGSLITKHSARVTKYEPYLTLHGMRIIAELNQ